MKVEIVESWDDRLISFAPDRKDIYFGESYVKLYENEIDKALCIVATEGEFCALMPILRRKITPDHFDFETPYGYGGFITSNADQKNEIAQAIEAIKEHLYQNKYIAGFIRFHPLLGNANLCGNHIQVIEDRYTVAMDLRPCEQDIWLKQVHTKNRNTIKRAQKHELTFIADHDFKYMDHFIGLYNQTMDKLSADGFYYFDRHYYQKLLASLGKSSFLAVVKYHDQVISACIIMYQQPWGHYHLSGSDRDYLHLDPNNFMLWNAAMELKRLGVDNFHLGGGIDSNPENSLLKFKERFSGNKYMFAFGKMIFNDDLYDRLCSDWQFANKDKAERYKHFLLKYRY